METGIRVDLAVGEPGACPMAETSAAVEEPVTSVARASATDASGRVREEFRLENGEPPEGTDIERVGSYDSHDVYGFARDPGDSCVCDAVERIAGPVSNVHAEDGTLYVSFHAPDVGAVRDVVEGLREAFEDVSVRQLRRADDDRARDLVAVDRGRLTARQREVLRTAHEMGYFAHPKGANAGEVADALDISPSTFTEHLAAAEGKVMDALLER